jgi:hypothetical protein
MLLEQERPSLRLLDGSLLRLSSLCPLLAQGCDPTGCQGEKDK